MEHEVAREPPLETVPEGRVIEPEDDVVSQPPEAGRVPVDPDPPSYVYALGSVEPRYPSLGIEKEVAQVAGRDEPADGTDRQLLRRVITDPANRYLARRMCWMFLVDGLESYILVPSEQRDLDLLLAAFREYPSSDEVDVVIGMRGPIAPPEACNGAAVPIVVFEQLYSFSRGTLVDAIPRPESVPESRDAEFRDTAREVFDEIIHVADNAGSTDEHRAVNYLAVRYPRLYRMAMDARSRNAALTGIEVRRSPVSGVRRIVDVVFSYTDRQTDVTEKQFVRVDVTEMHPFLVKKLSPYYDNT